MKFRGKIFGILSIIFGILGIALFFTGYTLILAPLAIIFGIIGLFKDDNKALPIIGIILGFIGFIVVAVYIFLEIRRNIREANLIKYIY